METGAVSNVFVVGDYVTAYGAGPDGYAYNGMTAKIMDIREDGTFSGQFISPNGLLLLMDFTLAERRMDIEQMEKTVAYLKKELASATTERDAANLQLASCKGSLIGVKSMFSSAMKSISDAIWEESDARGWCDEVGTFMERVNDSLPTGYELILREQEYEVETVITGTASTTHMVTVMAGSQDDANKKVEEDPDKYVDGEDVLNDEYRLNWDSIEVEVQ